MIDIIVIALLALTVGGAVGYIVWQKKKGQKCIGCPYAHACGKGPSCDCHSSQK